MAARTRRKAAIGDAALERSGCFDGGLWGRERRAFADCRGSRSPGVYTDRYACDNCPHRGSSTRAHTCAYSNAYPNAHAGAYTSSDPLRPLLRLAPTPTSTPEPTPTPDSYADLLGFVRR